MINNDNKLCINICLNIYVHVYIYLYIFTNVVINSNNENLLLIFN